MTRSTVAASARFRQRKLTTKQALQVLREDQIDAVDEDGQRNVPKVETGVEKGEEIEHHLQAALSASQAAAVGGKVAQIYIPTPDTIQSSIQYDQLYPLTFPQPATYIRFSSTVEDCCGCPYDMDDEDDQLLQSLNKRDASTSSCSEDQFEEVMNFYEETAQAKQPYAAVDNSPVLTYEEIEDAFEESLEAPAKIFSREIYDHWKSRRLKTGNRSLFVNLKVRGHVVAFFPAKLTSSQLETGAETDDSDPYVCFRRREVRQVRKTRGRDAHSAEKLKKLRKELEEARQIMALIRQREITKREQLAVEKQLFEQRSSLRQVKLNLPEQYREGDDDLLINQRSQRKKSLEMSTPRPAGPQLRMPQRPDGRFAEVDLVLLQDVLADKERQIQEDIEMRIAQQKQRSEGYLDMTRAPLTPPLEESGVSSFRTAMTEYLPTPPASITSEHSSELAAESGLTGQVKDQIIKVRYASPSYDGPNVSQPSFRRRIGRGGRLMIDRRGMRVPWKEGLDDTVADRCKFDREDDEDEIPTYEVDPYDVTAMRYRARNSGLHQHYQAQAAKRQQVDALGSQSQHQRPPVVRHAPPD
ncbi:MAG: hypothetical protein LQ348_001093 [Seirophora lacunosa]|nr:MAG: hypothetical protein LQ344_001486 [Seirophora lacunosa]KAI4206093.1 MAG: hypothetical protein LQ348_001093 [Seirophora lacunosa]